jgi:hypothetical protein
MTTSVDFRMTATVEIDRYAASSVATGDGKGDEKAPQ